MNSFDTWLEKPGQAAAAGLRAPAEHSSIAEDHAGLVYAVALRLVRCPATAQEVTQDVFLLLTRKAGTIRPGHVSGWLHRTAVLKSRERLRSEARYRRRVAEYARQQEDAVNSRAAETAVESVLDRLDTALDQLEDADRRVIFLRYFEGLDARDMGARLGISPEAAQKQCERARARLAKKLAGAGVLSAAMLQAGLAAVAPRGAIAAAAAGLRRESSAAPLVPAASMFTRWVIGGGVAAALVFAWRIVHHQPRPESPDAVLNARPDFQRTMPEKPALFTPDTATKPGSIAAHRPDFPEIAALLERADDGDVAAAATAEKALSDCDPAALLAAADTLREMPLPVNQLRVLALGMVRHLVSRDPKTAVLTGERLWRAQHGSSAPILASLVNEALARWHRTNPAAAARWWDSVSAENIFEDRGAEPSETGGFAEHAFRQARDLERTARDTAARLALALRWQETEISGADLLPPWPVMADVLAHKLTAAQSAELAGALDVHPAIPEPAAFAFRLALALLPTTAPSVETLRRTATRAGTPDPNPDAAAAVVASWHQRDPAAAAAWLASIRDTPDCAWIATLLAASHSSPTEPAPASPPAPSP